MPGWSRRVDVNKLLKTFSKNYSPYFVNSVVSSRARLKQLADSLAKENKLAIATCVDQLFNELDQKLSNQGLDDDLEAGLLQNLLLSFEKFSLSVRKEIDKEYPELRAITEDHLIDKERLKKLGHLVLNRNNHALRENMVDDMLRNKRQYQVGKYKPEGAFKRYFEKCQTAIGALSGSGMYDKYTQLGILLAEAYNVCEEVYKTLAGFRPAEYTEVNTKDPDVLQKQNFNMHRFSDETDSDKRLQDFNPAAAPMKAAPAMGAKR